MATVQDKIAGLYAAFFNRAPDKAGFDAWVDALSNETNTLQDIAAGFAGHPVFTATYGSMSETDFVNAIYTNMLGSTADAGGLAYYTGKLANEVGYTRSDMVAEFIGGVLDADMSSITLWPTLTQAEFDAAVVRQNLMQNKVTVSQDFMTKLGTATNVTDALNPETDAAYLASIKILSGVTDAAATVTTATNMNTALAINTATAIATLNTVTTIDDAAVASVEATQQAEADEVSTPTYTITAAAASVTEGGSVVFTVTASEAKYTTDTTLNYQIAGVAVAGGTASPSADLGKVTGTVTIAAGATTGTITLTPTDDGVTEGYEGFTVSVLNADFSTAATSGNVVIMDGAEAGQTFSLTSGTDTITGTSGDDTVNAVLQDGGATGTTVAPGDTVNGGDGSDTLNISVAGNPAAYVLSAIQTNAVETLAISNFDTTDTTDLEVDATLMTGLTAVNLSSSSATGDTKVSNLKNIVDAEMTNGSGDLTLTYQASVVSGTADVQDLTLANVTAGAFVAASVETVNVASTVVANTLTTLTAAAATTLTFSGDKNLTVTDDLNVTNAAVRTITSTMTGDLSIVENSSTVTATLGAGNDTYKTSTAVADTYTVNAGNGEDELSVTAATVLDTALETARYTNFEALQINNIAAANATFSQDMSLLASTIDTVTIVAQDNTDGNADMTATTALTNAGASMTLKFESLSTVEDGHGLIVAASVAALSDSDTDTLAVVMGTTTAASGTTTITNGVATVTATVTASNAETMTILSQGGTNYLTTVDAADLTSLTITGDKSLSIGALSNTTLLATINASGMTSTAALIMGTNASTTASTITGTANADTLTGGTLADTINGGAGIDTINAGAGNNTINAEAGNDIINITAGATGAETINAGDGDDTINTIVATLTALDTIDGGAGTDKLKISDTGTITDDKLTGVTSVETLTMADAATTITLGTEAAAAGITTVDYTLTPVAGKTNSLTLDATFTNDVTVKMGANTDTFSAAAYTKTLTVTADIDSIESGDTITGGTALTDILTITLDGTGDTALAAVDLAGVTEVETFKIGTNLSAGITLSNNNIAANDSLTVDGTALTGSDRVLTVVGTAEVDGTLTVLGGAGADVITGTASTHGDILRGNAGNDTFNFATANFTSADTVEGGAGTLDAIDMDDAATVVDADFTLVTGVEKLTAASTLTATISTLAQAAGITTVAATGALNLTIAAGYTNNLTLALVANADTVTGTAYTGTLAVTYADADHLTGADTIIGGTGTNDSITFTGGTITLSAAELAGVTKVEKLIAGADAASSFTLADVNTASGLTMTIDGSALVSTNALTVDGALETNGQLIVIGGAAGDGITGTASSMGDNLSGNGGADTFTFATANLTSIDTVSGGAGTDILTFSDSDTLADSDFTGVTSVETLTLAGTASTTVLGAQAAEAGIVTVNAGSTTSSSITLGSGFTNTVTVALANNNDTLVATEYTGALTVTVAADDDLDASDTITGGTGSDTLTITFDTDGAGTDTITATEMANVTKIETIKFASNVEVDSLALHDNNIAAAGTMTINATLLTSAAATFDGSAELDGSVTYNGGAGIDTVTGTVGNDTINGNAGADVLAGYSGADTLTGGTGADVFAFTAAAQSNSVNQDSITDFVSGTDKLSFTLDMSAQTSSVTFDATVQTAVAGKAAAENALSGSVGQVIYDTTNSVVYVNANANATLTTLDYQVAINPAATAASTIASADVNFTITGGTAGDIIVSGAGVDTITGGLGADTITAGAGIDSIILGATGDVDTIIFSTTSDGYTVGIDGTGDSITGFYSTSDVVSIRGALNTALDDQTANDTIAWEQVDAAVDATPEAINANDATDEAIMLDGSELAVADFDDISVVAAELEEEITLTAATGHDLLVVIEDTATNDFGVWLYVETGATADQFDVEDLTFLGVFTADNVAAGDFNFA